MRRIAYGQTAGVIAGLTAVALLGTACGGSDAAEPSSTSLSQVAATSSVVESSSAPSASRARPASSTSPAASTRPSQSAEPKGVTVKGERGVDVTMVGPIAQRYSAATPAEKQSLGLPLTGDHNAGARDSGVVFQQFQGGVITAKNAEPGTPAFLTSGKTRDAWNVVRDANGVPARVGTNGSAGPLGAVTSDETVRGDVHETSFEHGSISYSATTGKVTVKVNGNLVPAA